MLRAKLTSTANTAPDVDLASGDFTDANAAAKGWVDYNLLTWQTTSVRMNTALNQISFYGQMQNVDVQLVPGVSYTLRAYLSAKSGGGTPSLAVNVSDSGGLYASDSTSTVGTWAEAVFTPDEALNDLLVRISNGTNTDSSVTCTAVQLYRT